MAKDSYFEGDKNLMCRKAFEGNGGLAAGNKTIFFMIIIILQSPDKIRNSPGTLVQRMETSLKCE